MAQRSTHYQTNSVFIERWSARAMSGKAMPKQELSLQQPSALAQEVCIAIHD